MDDLISRQAAIDALKNDMASLDHIIKGMSANDVRLDAYVSQRNQVNYDIYTINNLPPALSTNLAEVGTDCISREQAIDICDHAIDLLKGQFGAGALVAIKESIEELPPTDPTEHCERCMMEHMDNMEKLEVELAQAKMQLPPAQPERIKGHWIDAVIPNDNGGLPVQVCDQCNTFFPLAYTGGGHSFCPHCGADMREVTT